MEGFDLKGFEEFVAERDLVPEAHRSFYVHWVRRFLTAEFNASQLDGKDKVEASDNYIYPSTTITLTH